MSKIFALKFLFTLIIIRPKILPFLYLINLSSHVYWILLHSSIPNTIFIHHSTPFLSQSRPSSSKVVRFIIWKPRSSRSNNQKLFISFYETIPFARRVATRRDWRVHSNTRATMPAGRYKLALELLRMLPEPGKHRWPLDFLTPCVSPRQFRIEPRTPLRGRDKRAEFRNSLPSWRRVHIRGQSYWRSTTRLVSNFQPLATPSPPLHLLVTEINEIRWRLCGPSPSLSPDGKYIYVLANFRSFLRVCRPFVHRSL